MSRYSNYSAYRTPYLDSYSSTNYSYPTYESKFESLVSRNPEGAARSRAGTSTKYDYLSSYASNTSKYDKYERTPSYGSKTSYSSSVLDADDLTRSYFENTITSLLVESSTPMV